MEDAKRRDHNKLGREMELFTTVDVIGQGLPLFPPKGTKMTMLQRWIEDLEDKEWGYVRTRTPLMAKSDSIRFPTLGLPQRRNVRTKIKKCLHFARHFAHSSTMYIKNTQKSYRDLPYRMSETSTLFLSSEDSGEMHGLTRVRQLTITEAHNVIRPDQAEEELKNWVRSAYYKCLTTLGLQEM